MDKRQKERIFREVLAALISSRLTSSDLRSLADLLSDGSFSYRLGKNVYELSRSIDPQASLAWQDELEPGEPSPDNGLVDLAYSVVQRRRMPKRRLISLLDSVSSRSARRLSEEMPARALLESFFSMASTSQAQKLLRELGMDVAEDPYLGGISSRSRS